MLKPPGFLAAVEGTASAGGPSPSGSDGASPWAMDPTACSVPDHWGTLDARVNPKAFIIASLSSTSIDV
jgi:hypothetical protein